MWSIDLYQIYRKKLGAKIIIIFFGFTERRCGRSANQSFAEWDI